MKRVLSYSLFKSPTPIYWRNDGTEDRMSSYMRYLPALVRAHHAIWPGYELRIYHDEASTAHPYFIALRRMHDAGLLRLMDCGKAEKLTLSMFWRMRALFDEHPHLVVTCDLDAFPLLALRHAVEEFAESEKAVAVFRGCETHNSVLGGGFGAKADRFRQLVCTSWEALVSQHAWDAYGSDESFLRDVVWPRVWQNSVVFQGSETSVIPVGDRRTITPRRLDDVLPVVQERGNEFAPYIGSAGYDVRAAVLFFDTLPLPEIGTIRRCEDGQQIDRVIAP